MIRQKNYRRVYILNCFSKIYEGFAYHILTNFTEKNFSLFVATYRKYCSSNHVLLWLIEERKKSLDEKSIIGIDL